MRKKVWLARQDDGGYSIFIGSKPFSSDTFWYNARDAVIRNLCKDLVEQWFGLKKHIRSGTCIEGYFNVSFKPIRRKK